MSSMVERFLLARFIVVLLVGAMDTLGLHVFHVPYALLLGALLGFLTLVPSIGFILGLIPVVIVSFTVGNSLLQTVLIALPLAGMSAIDTYILTPKMVGNRLNLSPLMTFLGIFAGGLLWGISGMLLSVPILGIASVVFDSTPGLEPWADLLSGENHAPPSPPRERRAA
jgi:predicted PurR-regulated permease PerM